MGRLALETDPELRDRLVERFGKGILDSTGAIDRQALAGSAFDQPEGRRDLTLLTFPTLYRLVREKMDEISERHRVVVFDAALIFEWGVEGDFDLIVTVSAPPGLLIERAVQRLGISPDQAGSRLKGQLDPDEKMRRADRVLWNDRDPEALRRQAEALWEEIIQPHSNKEKGAVKAP